MSTASGQLRIALVTGGSGGHVFPAEATARALLERGAEIMILTDDRGQVFADDLKDVAVHRLPAAKLGDGLAGKIRTAINLIPATKAAWRLLRQDRPAAIVGFGGIPTVGPLIAALLLGIPVVIHDQNAVLGRANRLFVPFARTIAASFPGLYGLHSVSKRVTVTGNPVRSAIRALYDQSYPPLAPQGPVVILVTGGSQGARIFSEVVPAAIAKLPPHLRNMLKIVQQCREEDLPGVRAAYAALGQKVELAVFFRDLPAILATAHLVIGRAGASTIAELAVAGRPAILVPLPHSVTGDQAANAEILAGVGGAWVMPQTAFTPEVLALRLESLLTLPESLQKAAMAAKSIAVPDAAMLLANAILAAAGGAIEHQPATNMEKAA